MIHGEKMTVIWNVEDFKTSQKQPDDIKNLVTWLNGIYGDIKVHRGNKYNDLIMDIKQ